MSVPLRVRFVERSVEETYTSPHREKSLVPSRLSQMAVQTAGDGPLFTYAAGCIEAGLRPCVLYERPDPDLLSTWCDGPR
jgi:hypothetical protein